MKQQSKEQKAIGSCVRENNKRNCKKQDQYKIVLFVNQMKIHSFLTEMASANQKKEQLSIRSIHF